MRIAGIKEGSLVDGEGVRYTIFFSGCLHNCPECHNSEYQNFEYGEEITQDKLITELISSSDLIDGITLSGGDPLFQYTDILKLLKKIKEEPKLKDLNIWLYTGFKFEMIPIKIKKYVDVVVDGRYEKDKPKADWRGSNKQRIFKKVKEKWMC